MNPAANPGDEIIYDKLLFTFFSSFFSPDKSRTNDMDTKSAHRRPSGSIGHFGMLDRSASQIHRLLDEKQNHHHIER